MPYDSTAGIFIIFEHAIATDLNYWAKEFIGKMNINKEFLSVPSAYKVPDIPIETFIAMLFDENYSYNLYTHHYIETTGNSIDYASNGIGRRLQIYRTTNGLYTPSYDSTAIAVWDIFNLEYNNDTFMLDKLLEYRMGLYDATSNPIIDISDYSTLTTKLSKLIYVYLDIKLNDNYDMYDDASSTAVTPGFKSLLEIIYELVIIESIFNLVSARSVSI